MLSFIYILVYRNKYKIKFHDANPNLLSDHQCTLTSFNVNKSQNLIRQNYTISGGGSSKERMLDTENPGMGAVGKEVKGRTHTYYQVLIDGRDSPYITHRAQTESVTFLGNHSENTR